VGEYITGILTGIRITDIIDMVLVAFLAYQLLGYLRSSRAAQLAKGIAVVLVIALIAEVCNLYVLSWIIEKVLNVGMIALIVVFQPELRRFLDRLGRTSSLSIRQYTADTETTMQMVDSIVKSIEYFSKRKEGALIIIERETALTDIAETGTIIDAKITTEGIDNIFYKGAPLHDGATILRNDRIYAAGCVLPLTQNPNLSRDLGTRHRAAIGISEVSDAYIIVVSEETGIISVARNGKLTRFLDPATVEKQLLALYMADGQEESLWAKASKIFRKGKDGKK